VLHLALAGGDELSAVNKLTSTANQLAAQVAAGAGTDGNYAQEQQLLHDMTTKLASARQIASSAVSAVLGLTASGFPGNKATVTSARAQLTQLRGPAGLLGGAQGDLGRINNLLSLRS
jgi:type IV secretory pathway TrbL component